MQPPAGEPSGPDEAHPAAVAPPAVRPLDVDGVGAVAALTVAWAVAAVVCWFFRDSLQAQGRGWWWWTCAAGTAFGVLGLPYVLARRKAYRAASSSSGSAPTASDSLPGSDSS